MRRLACTAIALAVVGAADHASASVTSDGGYKYVAKKSLDVTGYHPDLEAKCPKHTHVLGGGLSTSALVMELRTHHSAPLDTGDPGKVPDDGWRVALESFEPNSVFVWAVCGTRPVEYVKGSFTADAQARTGPVPLECPQGTDPMSGGTRGSAFTFEVATFPGFPNAWNVTVDSASADDQKVRQYAVCADFNVDVTAATEMVDPMSGASVTADCTGNRRAVGGGASGTTSAPQYGVILRALFPAVAHDGWTLFADSNWTDDIAIASYAVCAKPAN